MAETTTAANTLDSEWVDEFGDRYFAAWNSRQPERLLELMSEDVVYEDESWYEPMHGHEAVRGFLEWLWRAFPDMEFEYEKPLIAADRPTAAWVCDGWATNTGSFDPPGKPPTNARCQWRGVDIIDFRDGKIARLRIRYDTAKNMVKLGFLQRPDGLGRVRDSQA